MVSGYRKGDASGRKEGLAEWWGNKHQLGSTLYRYILGASSSLPVYDLWCFGLQAMHVACYRVTGL